MAVDIPANHEGFPGRLFSVWFYQTFSKARNPNGKIHVALKFTFLVYFQHSHIATHTSHAARNREQPQTPQAAKSSYLPLADTKRAEHQALDQLRNQHQEAAGSVHEHLGRNNAVSDKHVCPLQKAGEQGREGASQNRPLFTEQCELPFFFLVKFKPGLFQDTYSG